MTQARGWSRETFSLAIALQNLMWGVGGSFLGAMAAGLATMDLFAEPGFFERLGARCARLVAGLNEAASDAGVAFCAQHRGGLAGLYMLETPPSNFEQVQSQDVERFRRFYHLMLDEGVYLPPSPVEAFFFSAAHTDDDIDQTIAAAQRALIEVA